MLNLVESNVFIRSLYISVETYHSSGGQGQQGKEERRQSVWGSKATPAYLTHSWLHFPEPLSRDAIAQTKAVSEADLSEGGGRGVKSKRK